jgi:MoxR-like ATPase
MILLQTKIEGTAYQVKPLADQAFEKTLVVGNPEDMRISSPIPEFAKFPLGTIFVAQKYSFPEEDHLVIEAEGLINLMFNNTPFKTGIQALNEETRTKVLDYVVDYMIDSIDFGVEKAKEFAAFFEEDGYTCNWDEKIPTLATGAALPKGANLKRTIAATYPVPTVADCGFHIDPDMWFLLVRNCLRGENTLITGPTGSGKTELISHLARVMSKDMSIQDMGTLQDAQSALLGVHRLNKEGHSEFETAPFVDHIKGGGIVLLDEINRAPMAANNILFPCLDKRRYLPIDIACAEGDRRVDVHPETFFIATANLGSEYAGTNALDRALLDRFFIIEMDYPQEEDEIRVIVSRTGVQERQATAVVKVANEIRKQYKSQDLSSAISVRHTLQAANLIADGFDVSKALMQTVMPLFEDSIGVSERSKVLSIVSAF